MSGHSKDPIAEESKRFFTFFNLSMFLVAITGIEIVIIYVQTFDGSYITVFTFFAVIYMGDTHPVIDQFEVTALTDEWKSDKQYAKGDFVKIGDSYFQASQEHTSSEKFGQNKKLWTKVKGIPHQFSWKITQADTVEIHSEKPENPFFLQFFPEDEELVEGTQISLLAQSATTDDFRIKVRSEAFWTEN
jgi:hypothetical protein